MNKSLPQPNREALVIEDVVTATLLKHSRALLQYGCNLKEAMFLRKRNWSFIEAALDLTSANRFGVDTLVRTLEEKGDVMNPGDAYGELLQSLEGDYDFNQIYPLWLEGARKRFVARGEAALPVDEAHPYGVVAAHRSLLWYQASMLGGMDIGVHINKALKAMAI